MAGLCKGCEPGFIPVPDGNPDHIGCDVAGCNHLADRHTAIGRTAQRRDTMTRTRNFPISEEAKAEAKRSQVHRARMDRIFAGDKSAKFSAVPRRTVRDADYRHAWLETRDIRRFG